jgi:hypothetical protein
VLIWQDRANSTVQYDANGFVTSETNPNPPPSGANGMNLFGFLSGPVQMNGVIYQPRGAYVSDVQLISFGATFNTRVQLITGAVDLGGFLASASITLGTPTLPLTKFVTAIIQ